MRDLYSKEKTHTQEFLSVKNNMQIKLHEITVQELVADYQDNQENDVMGYGGKLNICRKLTEPQPADCEVNYLVFCPKMC